MTTSLLVLDQALGLLDHHLRDLHVALRRLVEGRRDDLALHRALHVGDLFRPLVDEQHDEVHLGVIGGDRVGDRLQQHRLAGARRRDDQPALALAERRHQVHDARGQVLGIGFEPDAFLRVERRQVLEEDALLAAGRRLEVDRLDLDQREVALAFLRRPDLPGDGVAGVQIELADLRRRDVDVVGPGEVVVVGRAQEAEAVGQHLEHALGEDEAGLGGAGAQDLEDQLLLAHAGGAGDLVLARDLGEGRDAHFLERREVQRYLFGGGGGGGGVRVGGSARPVRPEQRVDRFPQFLQPFAGLDRNGQHRTFMELFELLQMPHAFGARQLVHLGRDDQTPAPTAAEPVPGMPIRFEPGMPAVDEQQHAASSDALARCCVEVRAGDRRELPRGRLAASRVSVAREVDEVKRRQPLARHAIEIGETGLARRRAGPRHLLPHQRVDQTRFADVRPAGQRQFRQPFAREARRHRRRS